MNENMHRNESESDGRAYRAARPRGRFTDGSGVLSLALALGLLSGGTLLLGARRIGRYPATLGLRVPAVSVFYSHRATTRRVEIHDATASITTSDGPDQPDDEPL